MKLLVVETAFLKSKKMTRIDAALLDWYSVAAVLIVLFSNLCKFIFVSDVTVAHVRCFQLSPMNSNKILVFQWKIFISLLSYSDIQLTNTNVHFQFIPD